MNIILLSTLILNKRKTKRNSLIFVHTALHCAISSFLFHGRLCLYLPRAMISQPQWKLHRFGRSPCALLPREKLSTPIATHIYFDRKSDTMSGSSSPSLLSLPIELIYRILDCLDHKVIFLSVSGVCQRLDVIIDTYHPYQVNFTCWLLGVLAPPSKCLKRWKNKRTRYVRLTTLQRKNIS